jgi:hypothetical protein
MLRRIERGDARALRGLTRRSGGLLLLWDDWQLDERRFDSPTLNGERHVVLRRGRYAQKGAGEGMYHWPNEAPAVSFRLPLAPWTNWLVVLFIVVVAACDRCYRVIQMPGRQSPAAT